LNFIWIEIAYIAFERTAFSQASAAELAPGMRRIANLRSYLALGLFSCAAACPSGLQEQASRWSPAFF